MIKDQGKWQLYRLRFSQAEKERNEIFAKLESCNERLKKLLQISEDNVDLENKRGTARNFEINAVCRFWRQASRVFSALSVVWNCNCRPQHSTRLLLEHRTKTPTDFHLLYSQGTKDLEEARRIRIIEKGTDLDTSASIRISTSNPGAGTTSAHTPIVRDFALEPRRSAMKSNTSSHGKSVRFVFP